MVQVVREILYRPTIEDILKYYYEKHTNQYPQGCYVRLYLTHDNDIRAEITPKDYNNGTVTVSTTDRPTNGGQ